jgi:predicted acylesterase/phospholipase RssA
MEKQDYENLIFEGGGVLSFSYFGAIVELERIGMLQKFKRFAGTSVGSVFAALLAADFTALEILRLQKKMADEILSCKYDLLSAFNIFKNNGVNSLDSLKKQIQKTLNKKLKPDITLDELFKKTGKELVLVSCCVNRQKTVYFHHSSFGNVKLIDAIIASLAAPLFFQPIPLTVFETKDYFIDGGIVDNYPIWVFNDINVLYKGDFCNVDKTQINSKTLGLKLLCFEDSTIEPERQQVDDVFKLFRLFVNILTSRIDKINFSPSCEKQSLMIPTGNIYFLDFDIKNEQISELLVYGEKAIKKHFESF